MKKAKKFNKKITFWFMNKQTGVKFQSMFFY